MLEFISTSQLMQFLSDRQDVADKAGHNIEAILESRSPRLSDISHRMRANPGANYKRFNAFLNRLIPEKQ